jgi:hypothetical protein
MEFEYKIALIELASLRPGQAQELKSPQGKGWKIHFAFNMGGNLSCLIWGRKTNREEEKHEYELFGIGY